MMSLGSLYSYLQGIQSLLAPAMVAVFVLGIFSKRITPKAGEYGLIVGFLIGMVRLLTNILTNTGKDVMTGWFWESTHWFWHTNWLIFEIWLLVFIMLFMVVVSFFTPKPTAKQVEFITFTGDYKTLIRQSWNKWDVIASLGVVLFCVCILYLFLVDSELCPPLEGWQGCEDFPKSTPLPTPAGDKAHYQLSTNN